MSVANEKQESRRGIAERIAEEYRKSLSFDLGEIVRLSDSIEAALKERDERAAGICEAGATLASPDGVIPADDPEHERLQRIVSILNKAAAAIRNDNTNA